MKKISFVIADIDEGYMDAFIKYLLDNYQHQFNIRFFTNSELLIDYLLNTDQKVDILMTHIDLLPEAEDLGKVGVTAIITEIKSQSMYNNFKTIYKYQTGDRLYASIMDILTEKVTFKLPSNNGNFATKIIGVYSPIGGCGKTTIAIALAHLLTKVGKRVLYLNFEDIPSTSTYFQCNSQQDMSNLIFFLKERNRNLALKVNSIKTIDSPSAIEYISPTVDVQEMDELFPEDIEFLLTELKDNGGYDAIVIDTSSGFNLRISKVLQMADEILFITLQGPIYKAKLEPFIRDSLTPDLVHIREGRKITNIINKCKLEDISKEEIYLAGQKGCISIPRFYDLLKKHENRFIVKIDNPLGDALREIIKQLYA